MKGIDQTHGNVSQPQSARIGRAASVLTCVHEHITRFRKIAASVLRNNLQKQGLRGLERCILYETGHILLFLSVINALHTSRFSGDVALRGGAGNDSLVSGHGNDLLVGAATTDCTATAAAIH